MLKVSRLPSGEPEIFSSIQGEGVSAGKPTVFLRLAMCNLACAWCDTRYTWDWDKFEIQSEVMSLSVEEAERRVVSLGRPHLVITGGEPMLQQKGLAPLATSLKRRGIYCEVETNGTVPPGPEMAASIAQWNVSPKTASSGNRRERREVPDVIEAFRDLDNAYFKFVIVKPEDIEEVSRLVARYQLDPGRVLLMPEGVTARALQQRGTWLVEACLRRGYRFTSRLHILLWGDQRGR